MKIYLIGKCRDLKDTRNINMMSSLIELGEIFYDGFIENVNIKNKWLRKGIKLIVGTLNSFLKLIFLYQADYVIVLAMNHEKILEIFLAKLLKKKIIVDFYISNYDTQILDRKNFKEKSIFSKIFKLQDKFAILSANRVIFLNNVEANRYMKLINQNIKNINYSIIPLCKNKVKYKEPVLPFFSNRLKYLTICWWGTYIPLHGIEKIIITANFLKEKKFPFRLYLFGDSIEKAEKYKKMIKKLKLEDSVFINNEYSFFNRKLPKFLIENCDLALGNFGDSDKAKNVLVNKVVEAIQLKLPVLSGESIAASEFFDYKNDIYRCINQAEDIANKIIEISAIDKVRVLKRTQRGYEIFEKNFSIRAFKDKIQEIIK